VILSFDQTGHFTCLKNRTSALAKNTAEWAVVRQEPHLFGAAEKYSTTHAILVPSSAIVNRYYFNSLWNTCVHISLIYEIIPFFPTYLRFCRAYATVYSIVVYAM
jgi:hypothetical protein